MLSGDSTSGPVHDPADQSGPRKAAISQPCARAGREAAVAPGRIVGVRRESLEAHAAGRVDSGLWRQPRAPNPGPTALGWGRALKSGSRGVFVGFSDFGFSESFQQLRIHVLRA